MKVIKQGEVGVIEPFTGDKQILIVGSGEVVLMRSIDGNNYPMTDSSGEPLVYQGYEEDEVLLNSTINNDVNKGWISFSLEVISGEIKYLVK